MAASDNSLGSEVTMTEEHPTITGNKCFILEPKLTFKSKEDMKREILEQMPGVQEVSREECDFIVVLCFIVSRVGTDIDATVNALNGISESKPAVFMVLHHTFFPEKIVPDSRRFIKRSKVLTVDCLFHEDEGLLNCAKNHEALRIIHQCLQPQDTQTDTKMASSDEKCPKPEELLLVLLGLSRPETTAVGHMILGREETHTDIAPASQTKITVDVGEVDGKQVTVINSLNCFSSGLSTENIKRHLQLCIRLSSGGPCVFLLVIQVEKFTDEEREKMEVIFEEICGKHAVILFTETDEQQNQNQTFQKLEPYKNYVLNISPTWNKAKITELLNNVKQMAENEDFDLLG